jgi:Amt family ammonium transporter
MTAGTLNFNSFFGGLDRAFLSGMTRDSLTLTVPESVFAMFQLTFAAITPALIVGAFAERMKFAPLLWFTAIWLTFSYLPIAHMAWAGPGGLFWDWGVLDFAGGTVVHINAGVAGLVAALMVGRRKGWPNTMMPPHNLALTMIGASLLWVGWFGFNAGSAVAANGGAGMAMLVTQVATAAAALSWMVVEWKLHGKPSLLGVVSGAVAGLVAITPASGSCGPLGALAIGAAAGVLCFLASSRLKRRLGYDDALDVFGVHGVGGIVGALLTGVFASASLGGIGLAEGVSMATQVGHQALAVGVTCAWSAIVTGGSLWLISRFTALRVDAEGETDGLDLALHDERGYNL